LNIQHVGNLRSLFPFHEQRRPRLLFPCVAASRRLGWLILALALISAFAGRVIGDEIKNKSRAQGQFEQGMAQLNEKNYSQAEISFKRTLEIDPKFSAAYLGLADVHQAQGDRAGAGVFLQKAVAISPGSAGVQTAWGQYLFSQKRYLEAEKAYQNAIQLDPKAALPHALLGDLYLLALKKPEDAVNAYRACLVIDGTNSKANFMLATALLTLGKTDESETQLRKASELTPTDLAVRKALADLQLRRGELDSALANYRKVLEITPKTTWAQIGIGDVFMQRKDYNSAASAYQEALAQDSRSVEAQTKLGMSQEIKGDTPSAEASYKKALALDPKDGVAANNLAWLLGVKEQKPKEAIPWAQKAVAANPRNANFLDTQGWIIRANGDTAGGLAVLKKAEALAPQDPGILYHLGVVYQELGKLTLAVESYTKALAINKPFSDAADAQSRLAAIQARK
jgi:tetratricopeptide (TPR) repeat protein